MTIRFCTKRDQNGNKSYLIMSVKAKCYTRMPNGIPHPDDCIEISRRDLNRLEEQLEKDHWTHCDTM